MELKPKLMTSRLNTLLMKRALDSLESATLPDLIDLVQGFRQRKSKELYQRVRKILISRKAAFFPNTMNEQERAEGMANLLYTFASNKPA